MGSAHLLAHLMGEGFSLGVQDQSTIKHFEETMKSNEEWAPCDILD